jgi:hypothetical protein
MKELTQLGYPGIRKIAITNGSVYGTRKNADDLYLAFDGFISMPDVYLQASDRFGMSIRMYGNQPNTTLFSGHWDIPVKQQDCVENCWLGCVKVCGLPYQTHREYVTTNYVGSSTIASIDKAPGSTLYSGAMARVITKSVAQQIDGMSPDISFSSKPVDYANTFIPTVSALDIDMAKVNENIYTATSGNIKSLTPFDEVVYPKTGTNYLHTTLTADAVNVIVSEAEKAAITLPGAPTNVSAVAGDRSAKVSFTAPSDTGGTTITSYTVTANPGGATASGSTSPITVTGLENGTAYTFTVTATNTIGIGSSSVASNSVVAFPTWLPVVMSLLLDDDTTGVVPVCTLSASPATVNAGGSSTLTATCTPTATSYAWSDSACDKAKNTCTVTPATTTPYTVAGTNADGTGAVTSATVTVTPASLYALGVSNSGTGYGNVASSPVGIACYAPQPGVNYLVAPDCSENYASGTSVTLTATSASGSTFTGWSGACTGTGSCTVSMTEAKNVTATFAHSVTAPDCTLSANPSSITAGDRSTLTATCKPTPTSYIWTGGTCAGSGSTCTVTPTATTTYTVQGANAGGTKPAVSVTVTVAPNSPPVCTLTANPASVSSGGSSTLTATCNPAATSYTWTGGNCAGTTGSICMVKPTAATTYTVKGSNAVGTGAAASATVSVSQPDTCSVAPVSRPAGLAPVGTSNNESFSSSASNDRIDGGGGIDTVIYRCNRAYFTIVQTTTGWTVQSDAEGLDTLINIERLRFADKTLALDIASEAGKNAGKGYRIYQAAFNRTPDAGGLKFWVGKMDDGMDLVEVSARFIDSDEFRALYGTNPTDEVFVTKLYENVLHRKPDQGGLDYWVDQLKRGLKTRPKVLADFSESLENQANVWETIKNGIELPN